MGEADKKRLTCPCGFKGGTRNIRSHRTECPVWMAMVRREIADQTKTAPPKPLELATGKR